MPSETTSETAADYLPAGRRLADLADAAHSCRGCALFQNASQVVFGAGPEGARLMLVGEQPGDREDRMGEPFVGPAGRVLDQALQEAGVAREPVYVTNAVKHFKFVAAERGQRRIHKTPSRLEVVACRPWLLAELEAVHPEVVVLMGATAAKALFGNAFRLTQHRGEVLRLPPDVAPAELAPRVVVTVHPASVLRGPARNRDQALASMVADLRLGAGLLD